MVMIHKPWLIPVAMSGFALITNDTDSAIYLMLLAILTTQDDYFSGGDGDE